MGEKLNRLEIESQSRPRVTPYQAADLQKIDNKRRAIAVIFAPVATLGLVCFGVGWWEFRARRIQTAEEVTTGLGMRVVGAIPTLTGPSLARLIATPDADDGGDNGHLESIDAIRTTLLRDAGALTTRVLMVTSAVAGEGKTTVASNLATSLARAGRKTLLMDCDLRCPSAHQLFEQTLQPGLSEVLLNEIDLVDAIRPTTALDCLWLLPAGQWDREVIQALARPNVPEIFNQLKEEFDYIVVDSHPVLPATDSMLIGQYVDAVILSLMRDVSQAPRVHAASQRLTNLGIHIMGAVVNGMHGDMYENGYSYPAHAV
jgi:succinoglycan biosynthesis transport protein ExoP